MFGDDDPAITNPSLLWLAELSNSVLASASKIANPCSFRVGEQLDEEFEIGPGEYCYIPAGVFHAEATGEDGVELIFARDRQGGHTS